ncbi:MAG: hypothetical protein AAF664_18865 [Planctomycetota bacterium]
MKQLSPTSIVLAFVSLLAVERNTFSQEATDLARRSPLEKLDVLQDRHPRSFFFRLSENTYEPYQGWDANLSRLMGLCGKTYPAEIVNIPDNCVEFFTRFKERHPNQLVLFHANGRARDLRFRPDLFHAGHWLYFNGCKTKTSIPAEAGVLDIHVDDASLFRINMGYEREDNDDIGLCALTADGKPDWTVSEQVKLISVDRVNNVIRVERAQYGTNPIAFEAGEGYLAAHVVDGAWGSENNILWMYNFSTECPSYGDEGNCGKARAKELGDLFSEGGELGIFDGLEFDLFENAALSRPTMKNWKHGRWPDANADGKPDACVFGGVNTYAHGVYDFFVELREQMGDNKLIMTDGQMMILSRVFGVVNGMESEGWPVGKDYRVEDYSGGMNRYQYFRETSAAPAFNYLNFRWWPIGGDAGKERDYSKTPPFSIQRLVMACNVAMDVAIGQSDLPGGTPIFTDVLGYHSNKRYKTRRLYPIWDELVMGVAQRPGWLGRSGGELVKLAEETDPLMVVEDVGGFESLAKSIESDGDIRVDSKGLVVKGKPGSGEVRFRINDIPVNGPDLVILLAMSGDHSSLLAPGQPRVAKVVIPKHAGGKSDYETWCGTHDFKSSFYFSEMNDSIDAVSLQVQVEGEQSIRVSKLAVHAHPDVFYRKFENGLILANPSPRPFTFDLSSIAPNASLKRIQGSDDQDRQTNNGLPVGSIIQLPAKDGLFLVGETSAH